MYDIVSPYLSDEAVREIIVWTLAISAPMVFVMAFAVTRDAGFHCPLAVIRALQRFFLCCLAISLAYVGAYVADFSVDAVPLGPLLILFFCFMVSTLTSGIRHMMAPAISADNSWHGAWHLMRDKTAKTLPGWHHHRIVPPVR